MMGWSSNQEESRADHFIDERKHDWRPGDKPELATRLDRPISTAEDIAICVRGMKNIADAAALIQQYADMVAVSARVEQHRQSSDTVLRAIDPRLAR